MRTLQELNWRRELCLKVIEELEKMDDPRRELAVSHYVGQLASLNKQIAEAKPPPIVIGLKTAVIKFSSDKGH